MQEAISLYFDGAIQAQDCDYLSYRDFGLRCPECGHPVFLASGDVRQPHFRHFKAKDDELKDCKLRVKAQLPDKKQVLSIDRSQRERVFRQHFWNILDAAVPHLRLKEIQAEIEVNWQGWNFHEDWIKGWQVAAQKGKLKPLIEDYITIMFIGLSNSGENAELASYCSTLNQEVQTRTLYAVTDFLALKQSQKLLKVLFYYGLWDYLEKFTAPPVHQISSTYPWILADVLGILCVVPWAEAAHGMQNGHFVPRTIQVRPTLSVPVAPKRYQLWQSPQQAKSKHSRLGFGSVSQNRKS